MKFATRKILLENITGVSKVVEQKSLSYADILRELHPSCLIHDTKWITEEHKHERDEAVNILAEYGGRLMEYSLFSEDAL